MSEQQISREHEPSGFVRVFGTALATLAVGALGWAARRYRRDGAAATTQATRPTRDA